MDLKVVVDRLLQPPFLKSYSIIQLHDHVQTLDLLAIIHTAVVFIDDQNPYSPHKAVSDIRNEPPEDASLRISEFLRLLKYKPEVGDLYVSKPQRRCFNQEPY